MFLLVNLSMTWDFLKAGNKGWIVQIIVFLLLLSLLIILSQGRDDAPFIYTIF